MNIIFGIIIAVLVLVNAFLVAGIGYYAGHAKAEEELSSKCAGIVAAIIASSAKDDEGETEESPKEPEAAEKKDA